MNLVVQPNPHETTEIAAHQNQLAPDLVHVEIKEGQTTTTLILPPDSWQELVDRLAAVGISATNPHYPPRTEFLTVEQALGETPC